MISRLHKEEEAIKKRKAFKFQRDKINYQQGQVFTFARKFESMKASKKQMATAIPEASTCIALQPASSASDLSSLPDSESENELSCQSNRLGFTKFSLAKEVGCLRQD